MSSISNNTREEGEIKFHDTFESCTIRYCHSEFWIDSSSSIEESKSLCSRNKLFHENFQVFFSHFDFLIFLMRISLNFWLLIQLEDKFFEDINELFTFYLIFYSYSNAALECSWVDYNDERKSFFTLSHDFMLPGWVGRWKGGGIDSHSFHCLHFSW